MWSKKYQLRLWLIRTDFPMIRNQERVYFFVFNGRHSLFTKSDYYGGMEGDKVEKKSSVLHSRSVCEDSHALPLTASWWKESEFCI